VDTGKWFSTMERATGYLDKQGEKPATAKRKGGGEPQPGDGTAWKYGHSSDWEPGEQSRAREMGLTFAQYRRSQIADEERDEAEDAEEAKLRAMYNAEFAGYDRIKAKYDRGEELSYNEIEAIEYDKPSFAQFARDPYEYM